MPKIAGYDYCYFFRGFWHKDAFAKGFDVVFLLLFFFESIITLSIKMLEQHDELLDLVDERDCPIGIIWRSQWQKQKMKNVRAVAAFVENDKGQIWIPRRSASKKVLPLALDMSVSGMVSAGEDYDTAFMRETQEELNIDIRTVACERIDVFSPHEHGSCAFVAVYKIHSNEAPLYNPDDFCEGLWMAPQELCEILRSGEKAKTDLPLLMRLLYNCE